MRKFGFASLTVAMMAAGLHCGPAAAAMYQFTPMGSTPIGLPVQVQIEFAGSALPASGSKFDSDIGGIVSFLFRVGSFEADLGDLLAVQADCANPGSVTCGGSQLDYAFAPDKGSIRFNNTSSDFEFSYDGGLAVGAFSTDFLGPAECRDGGTCDFRGLWTEVGEPIAALFLIGGLAFAGLARRRPG